VKPLPNTAEELCTELNAMHGRLFDLANREAGNQRGNMALYLHEAANNLIYALNCQERGNPASEPVPLFALANAVGGMSNLQAIMAPRPDPVHVKEPVVSIDSASGRYAFFDGVTILQDFLPFTDEAAVLAEAMEFFKGRCDELPRVVRPRITKIRATS